MEQIKLIALVLFSIYTYFRYCKFKDFNKNKKLQLGAGEAINDVKLAKINQNQLKKQEKKAVPLDEQIIERFAKQQESLFSKKNMRVVNPEFSQIIKKSGDFNDIFGGEYQKCKKGKTYEMDPETFLYNGYSSESKLLFKRQNQPSGLLPNEAFFINIQQILQFEKVYIDQQKIISQRIQNNSSHNQSMLLNNFSNFSFGLNHQDDQQMKMEYQIDQSQSSSQSQKKVKQKKKKIQKASKKHLRIKRQSKKLLESASSIKIKVKEKLVNPAKSTKPSKFKKFICLQQQIKKKQNQLAVLRRLHSQINDS